MDYQDEWKYLRDRIKDLRIAKSMSIQALADTANMHHKNLSRIEAGKADGLTFSTLCRIADALEVPPGELVRR